MTIKDYQCKCGHNDFFFANKGSQKGIYCSYCGKWFKWADKDEQNLAMKQEPVLDKIRAEIGAYQSDAFYHDNVMMNKTMVLEIIDKYRKEQSK